MLRMGLHRRQIGSAELSWHELRVLIEHSDTGSAVFRARNPKSWAWDVDTDLLAAILFTLQGANWQRAGGKGDKPKPVERPKENKPVKGEEIPPDDKRSALDNEIARRRLRKARPGRQGGVSVG